VSESRARIVHFLDYGTDKWPYRAEELKVRLVQKHGLPVPLARLAADATIGLGGRPADAFKDTLRRAYRRLFGTRRIAATEKSTIEGVSPRPLPWVTINPRKEFQMAG